LKFKYSIDDIAIDFWFFEKFSNIEDKGRKFNSMVNLSKSTSNKKIMRTIVAINYNKVCRIKKKKRPKKKSKI